MSSTAPVSGVIADEKTGEMVAARRVGKKGGAAMMLSPANVDQSAGRRSRKISKKMMAKLKKMTPKQLKKLAKGGAEEPIVSEEGAGRRRKHTRRHTKKRGMFY
jgi:hypothetical protein